MVQKTNQGWKLSWSLSLVVLFLMVAVSAVSLLAPGFYRDNHFVRSVWRGNDLVTLAAAAPVFVLGLVLSRRGSTLGEIIRLGMLDYTLYNYAFYLTAAAFNVYFLPYVVLIILSGLGLLAGLVSADVRRIKSRFRKQLPARWIAGYLLFVAAGLSGVYLAQYGAFLRTGTVPEIITMTGHVTNIIPALDLTLLVPWLILGGVWLWRRKAWGYLLSGMMVVKGTLYMLVLAGAGYSSVLAGYPDSAVEIPLWGLLFVGFGIAAGILIFNVQGDQTSLS